ncbi:MAG: uroporphyrinogen decarboxylase family protein [Deltaproteobacteria bacterium]|nr:uroporphyrinogen decarboxylase family protein [Deltaproteobacteria bacterium]
MNGLERMRTVLRGEKPDRVPVFPLVHYGSSHAAGYKIRDFSSDPDINARCLIHAYRECGYDGVQPSIAVMVEGEAVGSRVEYPEDNVPFVKEVFLKTPDVDLLTMPEPLKTSPMSLVIQSTRLCAAEIGKEAYIVPSIMGPLNSAGQIRGVETLMFDFFDRPDFVRELLDFTTEMGIRYGKALLDAGAHGIFIGEAMCSPSFISPTFYRQFVLSQQKRLIGALLEYGAESTILHICANTVPIMKPYAVETGTTIIDLDWQVNVAETLNSAEMRQAKTLVRGNLDPATELLRGTPREVIDASRKLIESVGRNTRFILGSGCAVNPDSLPANCKAMVEAAERYGRF